MQDNINLKFKLDKIVTKVGLAVLALFIIYISYTTLYSNPMKKKLLGNLAPIFQTTSINKTPFNLSDVVGKKVILLNFWASWCPPCRDEVINLNQIGLRVDSPHFAIVALMEDTQPTIEKAREAYSNFNAANPINYPVYVDSDNSIADLYGVKKLPETFIIDLGGNILYRHSGPIEDKDRDMFVAMIQQIMY
ncbi:MAG: Alkyl hydroperoxide reductase/ Thiol specific antioxidant/ Mal allergen [uncultured bacterium]|nr:MAG: Alkyl hydroperoxide reductase/ Thiol specific antioxidant/ Mal allergen [uncultured bacterium]HLD43976.1 TlpA disulfide reductase family protein [bacterium]